ncbi:MAG: winged helix-turn-helix transcriptional regulator [Desulfobacteraceae bacterium]|nr:MAG: winged helix-turn-helix transcriptional regulator [Desulfobacteraceae bacterium]
MESRFKQQASSEVPALLAKLLEIPENRVSIRRSEKEPATDVIIKAGDRTFLVEFKGSSARAPLLLALTRFNEESRDKGKGAIPLLVAPYMGEAGRRLCEEHEMAWLDLSGNARIKAPGLLINVQGKPNRFKSAGRPPNLFAPKSSRIVRQFLIQPDRALNQRELSQAADLDEGYTSRIVRRLEDSGLIVRDEKGLLKPKDPEQLLDAWHTAYDFMRHRIIKGHVAARSGEELLHKIAGVLEKRAPGYAATGLCAAWLYSHFANFRLATFYLPNGPGNELFNALGFREDEKGANTWLVVPNDEGVFHGAEAKEGIRCVHAVQVYLDLKDHPERSAEAATRLRQDCLR